MYQFLPTIIFCLAVIGFCSLICILIFSKELFQKNEKIAAPRNIIKAVAGNGFSQKELKKFKLEGE